jgi:Tfp pilus assembly protein PilF
MFKISKILPMLFTVFLLNACTTSSKSVVPVSIGSGVAEQKLAAGISGYEEGDYKASQVALQSALDMGLSSKPDQVRAHKYLAFIHCVSGREKQCRDAFKKAIEIDPTFDLKPAEAGHPIWGPVFRAVVVKPSK